MRRRRLVLGAGGFLGAAWMLGRVAGGRGPHRLGPEGRRGDGGDVGGAVLAALLRAGRSPAELYREHRGDTVSVRGMDLPAPPPPTLAFVVDGEPVLPGLPALGIVSPQLVARALRAPWRWWPDDRLTPRRRVQSATPRFWSTKVCRCGVTQRMTRSDLMLSGGYRPPAYLCASWSIWARARSPSWCPGPGRALSVAVRLVLVADEHGDARVLRHVQVLGPVVSVFSTSCPSETSTQVSWFWMRPPGKTVATGAKLASVASSLVSGSSSGRFAVLAASGSPFAARGCRTRWTWTETPLRRAPPTQRVSAGPPRVPGHHDRRPDPARPAAAAARPGPGR